MATTDHHTSPDLDEPLAGDEDDDAYEEQDSDQEYDSEQEEVVAPSRILTSVLGPLVLPLMLTSAGIGLPARSGPRCG